MFRAITAAALFSALSGPLFADPSAALEVFRKTVVVNEEGKAEATYAEVTSVIPGEKLAYRITLTNDDETATSDITMVLPVDENLMVDPASVASEQDITVHFSVDGVIYAEFQDLMVVEANQTRKAEASDISNLKVMIPEISGYAIAAVEYEVFVE